MQSILWSTSDANRVQPYQFYSISAQSDHNNFKKIFSEIFLPLNGHHQVQQRYCIYCEILSEGFNMFDDDDINIDRSKIQCK
jgi:hypothetical protein